MPISDTIWNSLAISESRRSAENTPMMIPKNSARMVAQIASSRVAGMRSLSRSETGCRN